jgi:hypothetical protein
MNHIVLASAALALGLAAMPASALVTTLDFAGNICGAAGDQTCSNYSQIGQNYGDSAVVDVQYRSITTATGMTYEPYLKFWTGYGDLPGVVWGGAGQTGFASEILILPAAGYEVSLSGFDFATYLGRSPSVPFTISSISGTEIFNQTLLTNSPSHNTLTIGSRYFAEGIRLAWGPDGYDVGLDNISFDVRAVSVAPVPETSTWALMVLGFGTLGAAMRRSNKAFRLA